MLISSSPSISMISGCYSSDQASSLQSHSVREAGDSRDCRRAGHVRSNAEDNTPTNTERNRKAGRTQRFEAVRRIQDNGSSCSCAALPRLLPLRPKRLSRHSPALRPKACGPFTRPCSRGDAHSLDHVATGFLALLARVNAYFHVDVRIERLAFLRTAVARVGASPTRIRHQGALP
jgi:hypothetical protein